ncbi:capping protein inhibiting regulator of actin dynamics-like isoform X2 [Leptidea sinapis]|uniref:capping protein inhibiting regulator of actin dynamics-like isoform X2 n=1 Tax=Leptidea sinapis TaxID=189913 RepID=UPI0021449EDC|nr:capping protein inhibiting regulator of actin dynamics-like isoform X2 [Leptidea sinapis]
MVDDVKDITEKAESKEALDRARLARERREAEQRKRLDELRAHAAAAQAQREKRDEEKRRRQAEQRARDDDRRHQVEERKRAIWEASISRREALLQREKDRTERLERARAGRSAPRPAFAFGSSTPRLLEPLDSAGFFWAARSTNPVDQMNFFESLAASTTNVMFASAPLTRRASALQLDSSDIENKDEADRSPQPAMWSSVARRRTDLIPTAPAPRAPGRAYSMTRLDRLPATSPNNHLSRSQTRSGETTPGSRPGSAMSQSTVTRRPQPAQRRPRPASIAGTGLHTPRAETGGASEASSPAVSRDASTLRAHSAPRRARPVSLHITSKPTTPLGPGEGKPPLHRKPKPSKDHEKNRKSLSASPGRALSPSPAATKEPSVDKDVKTTRQTRGGRGSGEVSALEVTQKLEALQVQGTDGTQVEENENKENIEANQVNVKQNNTQESVAKNEEIAEVKSLETKVEEKKEPSVEKTDENDMTASMISRRITTEEQAKAALAERRRRAREELERQAEIERLRLQREAEEEAERQRLEEERQKREEEEARELAALQRKNEEEKLRKAIEAQQQLEREEAERKKREEVEKQMRLKEEEEKRRAAEEADRLKREELEREEKERLARKQRVEAIMARTRLKKQAEEDKKKQEQDKPQEPQNKNNDTQDTTDSQDVKQQSDNDKTTNGGSNGKVETNANVVTEVSVAKDGEEKKNGVESDVETTKSEEIINNNKSATADGVKTLKGESINNNANVLANVEGGEVKNNGVEANGEKTQVDVLHGGLELVGQTEVKVVDNGNVPTGDLLSFTTSQNESPRVENNDDVTAESGHTESKDTSDDQLTVGKQPELGNLLSLDTMAPDAGQLPATVGHISASFIQTERMAEHNQKIEPKLLEDDFTTHNGHNSHPLTLRNAI